MRGLIFILIGLVILMLGGCQFGRGIAGITKALESRSWPQTSGKITSSEVKATSSNGRNGGTSYTPKIVYTYHVADRNYLGDDPAPGRLWSSQSTYQAVERFKVGNIVVVYYAATNPAKSVLITGLHLATWGRLALGTLILFFGALITIAGIWVGFVMPPGVNNYSFRPGSAGPLVIVCIITLLFGLTLSVFFLSRMTF